MSKRQKSMRIFNFLGQHSADQDKVELYNPKKAEAYGTKCSMLVGRDGKPDSRTMGTGAYLIDTSTYGYVLASYTHEAYDGNTYTVMYCRNAAGECSLIYVLNETWASIVAPTAANFYDDQDTPVVYSALPFMPPQTIPGFAVDLNGNLWVALGVSGVFRVEIRAGVLYFYLTRTPFTSFINIDSGRAWPCPMDLPDSSWSAIGDLDRYFPKAEEAEADPPTYGVDYHYQLGMLGGKGAQMVGSCVFGRAKVRWTESDCYMIFGTGNDGQTQATKIGNGYGLAGFMAYNEWNDTLYWFSRYNGGSYLAATYGSAPEGSKVLDRVAIGSDYAVTIYDAGYQIRDVFQAAGAKTTEIKKVSWGEWGEWKNIPSTQRVNIDIDDEPGAVKIDFIDLSTGVTGVASVVTQSVGTSTIALEADHGIDKTYDGSTSTYLQYSGVLGTEYKIVQIIPTLEVLSATGNWNPLPDVAVSESSGERTYQFPPQTSNAFRFRVKLLLLNTTNLGLRGIEVNHYLTYVVPIGTYEEIRLYGYDFTLTNDYTYNFKLYEIYFKGRSSSTATLITEIPTADSRAVLTGLTASSRRDLGMFWARFIGTGNEYKDNLSIAIRCGSVAPVSIVSGTASGIVSGLTLTDAAKTFTTDVEIGDYVTIGTDGVKYVILGVAANVLTLASAPAAGTYSYAVYGSLAAATTWTEWNTLNARELLRGKPLRELLARAGGVNYLLSGTTGLLYVQAKAVLTLDDQGNSPELDYLVFTAITGDNNVSVFPALHDDDHQFISFRKATASTGNDVECARNVNGAWSVIYDKENTSYLSLANKTIMAFAGFCGAMQYAGLRAYYGVSNAYRALLGEFTTPALKGRLQGGKLAVGVEDYTGQGMSGNAVYPDESGKTWSSYPGVNSLITVAQSVFGGASFYADNDGSHITTPYHADFDFGADAFTIDCRIRIPADLTQGRNLLDVYASSTGDQFIFTYSNKALSLTVTKGGVAVAEYSWAWAAVSLNTWYHIELVRSGATMYCFVNGTALTATITTAVGTNNLTIADIDNIAIGNSASGYGIMYIDEWRMLKGTAAHTANFTSPVAAYVYDRSQNVLLHFDGDNFLKIYAKKDSNALTRYDSPVAITNLRVLPKSLSMQAGSNSRAAELAVDVQSYSGFKLDSIEFTAEDSTYN